MSSYVAIKCKGLTASVSVKYILSHGTKEEAVKRITQSLIPKGKPTAEQEDVIQAVVSTYYPTLAPKAPRKKKVEDVIEQEAIPEPEPNVTSETENDH